MLKILSISSNERMFKFTNILLALWRHGNFMKRRKLLLYATFIFFKAVLMQSNHIGSQYKVEQYVSNKYYLTLTEQLENFLNSKLALA